MNPEDQARVDAANQASTEAQEPTTPDVEPAPVEAAPAEPVVEAPAEPVAEPEVEDYNEDPVPTFNLPSIEPTQAPSASSPVPSLDPATFTDPYTGNVDMAKFSEAFAQRDQQLVQAVTEAVTQQVVNQTSQLSAQQMVAMRQEERAWKAAEKAYPELSENKELRDLVHNSRVSYAGRGANLTPKQAADKIFKFIGNAESKGAKDATESVAIQASAHLESASNTANEANVRTQENRANIADHRRPVARQARESLLKDWIKEGKIQL